MEDDNDGVAGGEQGDHGMVGINQGRWQRQEHAKFLEGLDLHGKEWKKIAEMIKTRTVVQIRTHAQKYFQKVAKSTGQPVMSTSKKGDVVRIGDARGGRPAKRKLPGSGEPLLNTKDGDRSEEEEGKESPLLGAYPGSSSSEMGAWDSEGSGPGKRERGSGNGVPANKKPKSISVPNFFKPSDASGGRLGLNNVKSGTNASDVDDDDGGVTPRTVAAATILLRPRIHHKLLTGGDTPKTREQAHWLQSQEARASQVLGTRRRSGKSPAGGGGTAAAPLSWESAAAGRR